MAMFETSRVFGGGDDSWLGSRHGVANAESGTLDTEAFSAALDEGETIVRSGYPVSEEDGLLVPYTGGYLRGFIIGDQELTGSGVVPVLWTGRVLRENLPVELEAPDNPYQFTFEPPFPAGDSGENGGGE